MSFLEYFYKNIKITKEKDALDINLSIQIKIIVFSIILLLLFIINYCLYSYIMIKTQESITANIALETMIKWDSKNLENTSVIRLKKDLKSCKIFSSYYEEDIIAIRSCEIIKNFLESQVPIAHRFN